MKRRMSALIFTIVLVACIPTVTSTPSFPTGTWFRDPAWQFIGAVATIVAILVSTATYVIWRGKKSLSYRVHLATPLLTVADELSGRVQVLFDGSPINGVDLVLLTILNSGNLPIRSSDYERALSIRFGEQATVLSAEIVDKSPANLDAMLTHQCGTVTFDPMLLNPRDFFKIRLLVTGSSPQPIFDARIVGIQRIQAMPDGEMARSLVKAGIEVVAGVALIVALRLIVGLQELADLLTVSLLGGLFAGFVLYDVVGAVKIWLRRQAPT